MQLITTKNLAGLMLVSTTPYFIYGEYFFYACLCFTVGNYIMLNRLTSKHKPFDTDLAKQFIE